MNKEALRQAMAVERKHRDTAVCRLGSRSVAKRVAALPVFGRAGAIGCYLALPHEVQTDALIERCREASRAVYVPAWHGVARAYRLARMTAATVMRTGYATLPEPADPEWVAPGVLALVLVPGVAFDRRGGRLGHGGGHYDRLLAVHLQERPAPVIIGLAFEFQLVAEVPRDAHDLAMDFVVTETRVYGPFDRISNT